MLTSVYTRARLGTGPDMSHSLAEVRKGRLLPHQQRMDKEGGREGGREVGREGRGRGEGGREGEREREEGGREERGAREGGGE